MKKQTIIIATYIVSLLIYAFIPSAHAQFVESNVTAIYTLTGEALNDNFGLEVIAVADYNGDGAMEFLISAPGNDQGAINAGKVYLVDGKTGATIREHPGTRANEARRNVCDASDVNNDGIMDYLVGTGDDWVYVYSGADGSTLYSLQGIAGEAYGFRSCGLGDINGDGFGEFIVGAWANSVAGNNIGKAYVISGIDGTVYREHQGPFANAQFGHTVGLLGDIDGDNVPDYAIGAPGPFSTSIRGQVYIYSGATGNEVYPARTPPASGRIYGSWVDAFGGYDFNSDGVSDYVLADIGDSSLGFQNGRLFLYDGVTGNEIYNVEGTSVGDGFGGMTPNPASALGDITGDGIQDLLVGSWSSNDGAIRGGKVEIINGSDGARLRTITSSLANIGLGGAPAGLGLVDGDGLPDFALGANGNAGKRGAVYVVAGIVPGSAASPLAVLPPHDITKDRYLSFDPSTNAGQMAALRVTRVGSVTLWYVSCALQDVGVGGKLSVLVQSAEFCEWTDPVIHVRGCEVVPGNEYTVDATLDDASFSTPLSVFTTAPQFAAGRHFGDLVGAFTGGEWVAPEGLVTANDIVAVVQKFQLLASAPHISRVDTDGKSPNGILASNDILRAVIAFAGGDFGFGVTNCLTGSCVPSCP